MLKEIVKPIIFHTTSEMLPDFISRLLDKIAKQEGFLTYKCDGDYVDNMACILTTITLRGFRSQRVNRKLETLHLICKGSPVNQLRKKNFQSYLEFGREIFVYSKMLPKFVEFQQEKGLSAADSFLSFPKVYACDVDRDKGVYLLMLEDLRPQNYEMWPKEKVIPLDHELLVLRELGKLHAVSFAMKDQRPEEFKEFTKLDDTFSAIAIHGNLKMYMEKVIDRAASVLENADHKKLMLDFRQTWPYKIGAMLSGAMRNEFAVVGHGDCWNNNFLFQYSDENKSEVKSVCFLDWQITRICPPVLDLLYNIFSSTDKPFRDQHYDKLLETYYSSLSEAMRKLGSDPEKLYTYDNLKAQLRKFGEFALLCGPLIIQTRLAGVWDVGDFDEYFECVGRGEEFDVFSPFDSATQQEYSAMINDLITDLVSYGYVKLA